VSRIISGQIGSLRLASAASATRPTADRVKESLFSSLESIDAIEGSQVLDLFAGTAALGLEAISRGAKSLIAVEKARAAQLVCEKNFELVRNALDKQGQSIQLTLKRQDVESYLASTAEKFDLVFVDPPYDFAPAKLIEILQKLVPLLNHGALVVVERSSKDKAIEVAGLDLQNSKTYGDTAVYFFRPNAQ
jgi:16S rRNA (guanine966-N2)-methyltransferase